jgi:hypothetical protein
MTSSFDENLRASPGIIRIARSEIRELRYRVLLGGIHLALEGDRDTDTFLFSINSASFTAARGFVEEFDDPGIIYGTLRDLGVPDGYIEAEGLEGAIRRIASWIHPSKIIDDEYPENYPDPNALLACAAELRTKFPNLTDGSEKQIIRMFEKVIPLGLPANVRQKLRSYLE